MVENDAVKWFSTIYDHINGTKNIDIRKAMDNLTSLKLKSHLSIMENIASIEEAFRIVKVATGNEINDDQKLYHLQEKLEADPRMSVVSTMALAKTDQDDYATILRKLVILDPAPSVVHKLSSLEKTVELCRRHLAGLCQNGAQCKYSHAPQAKEKYPGKGNPPSDKPVDKTKNKDSEKTPYKPPFKKPVIVSKEHRALVEYPRGKQTSSNPDGFSMNQLSCLRTLRNAEEGGWNTDNPSYYNGSPQKTQPDRFNMLRVHNATPPRRAPLPIRLPIYPDYSHLIVYPTLAQLNAKIAAITRSVLTYNTILPTLISPGPSKNPSKGLVAYVHAHAVTTSETPRHIGIFICFGWFSRIDIDTYIISDVLHGSERLFRLLYKVGTRFLNADTFLPEKSDIGPVEYMSFNPDSETYFHPDEPGSYVSTMVNISKYFIAIMVIKAHLV